jgi:UDP-N-acetylglucosamine:LPS N-acetylglucosamine transferase
MAIASGGGHWLQLRRLAPALDGADIVYVGVLAEYAADVPEARFYKVPNVTRLSIGRLLLLAPRLLRILIKERPNVVLTTGSAPGLIGIALAKTFIGARTVWIDSIANYECLSTSGRLARRFADVWLTQWPHLVNKPHGPLFWGSVL